MENGLSDLIVPKPLFGTYAEVRRSWLPVTKRALRDGTWKNALEDMEYMSLAERPEDIISNHPARYTGSGEFWQLCLVHDLIFKNAADNSMKASIRWEGLKYPWFLLSAFCSQGSGLSAPLEERIRFARTAVEVIMPWWDCFCLLDDRFKSATGSCAWPHWSYYIGHCLYEAGLSRERCRDLMAVAPEVAGEMIRNWIEDGTFEMGPN